MKKLLVVAVALASVNAFATRARTSSLGNSVHLIDTNTVYTNPADMFFVGGDYVDLEAGNTNVTPNNVAPTATLGGNDAEGMVVRSMGDAKMGLAIGHDSSLGLQVRALAATLFPTARNYYQQNPIELSYGMKAGDLAWAGTLIYSNGVNKVAPNEKENTLGARLGMRSGNIDASLGIGLANNYQNDTDGKFTGTLGLSANAGMWMDTVYLHAKVQTAGYKVENAAGTEVSKVTGNIIQIDAIDSRKKDGNEFFYGAGLMSYMQKDDDAAGATPSKITNLTLPVVIGIEQKANSWLTLRGSVTQSVLLNNTKTETVAATTAEGSPGANNTSVAIGAGLNFDKVTIDGTLRGLTTSSNLTPGGGTANQQLDGNTLFGQVGLTYMF
jgi:hypothetical protein